MNDRKKQAEEKMNNTGLKPDFIFAFFPSAKADGYPLLQQKQMTSRQSAVSSRQVEDMIKKNDTVN